MRHVRKPDLRLEIVPWLNVLLLAWMLSLLQSTFLYAPGLPVALTDLERKAKANLPLKADLPVIAGGKLPGRHIDARLSIQLPLFILDNSIHRMDNDHDHDLADALNATCQSLRERHIDKPVLLILAPGQLPLATFMKVCTLATKAGFDSVQLAASTDPYSARAEANSPTGLTKP